MADLSLVAGAEANRLRALITLALKATSLEAAKAILASEFYPEAQGPEMTREQLEAMKLRMAPVWQPFIDSLRGDAP